MILSRPKPGGNRFRGEGEGTVVRIRTSETGRFHDGSRQITYIHIDIYIHMYMCIYIYIYMYRCIYVCM